MAGAIALYGHTHQALVETRRTLMINPGSAADAAWRCWR